MGYLFDTNAISEVFRRQPNAVFVAWLRTVRREDQYTTMLVLGELYTVAFRSKAREKWLTRIDESVVPAMTVVSMDLTTARVYGEIRGLLMDQGKPLADADLQIAACALRYRLTLVTANVRHFERVPGLDLHPFIPGQR